jgi:hypothetical protein
MGARFRAAVGAARIPDIIEHKTAFRYCRVPAKASVTSFGGTFSADFPRPRWS